MSPYRMRFWRAHLRAVLAASDSSTTTTIFRSSIVLFSMFIVFIFWMKINQVKWGFLVLERGV